MKIRNEVLEGTTEKLPTPCGSFFLTLNEQNGQLFEVCMRLGKQGNCSRALLNLISVLLSVILQSDLSRKEIGNILMKHMETNCGNRIYFKGKEYHSCVDYAIQRMLEELASRGETILGEEDTNENPILT